MSDTQENVMLSVLKSVDFPYESSVDEFAADEKVTPKFRLETQPAATKHAREDVFTTVSPLAPEPFFSVFDVATPKFAQDPFLARAQYQPVGAPTISQDALSRKIAMDEQKHMMLGMSAPSDDLFARGMVTPVKTAPPQKESPTFELFSKSLFDHTFDLPVSPVSPIHKTSPTQDVKKPIGAGRPKEKRLREASISENPIFHELEVLISENLDIDDLHTRNTSEESVWNPLTGVDAFDSNPDTLIQSSQVSPAKYNGKFSPSLDDITLPSILGAPSEKTAQMWDPLVSIPSSMSVPFEVELPESERRRLASVNMLRRLESPKAHNDERPERRRAESAPWRVPPVPRGPDIKNKKAELFKTEMCRSWEEFGAVRFPPPANANNAIHKLGQAC